jgi:hypothetical protein
VTHGFELPLSWSWGAAGSPLELQPFDLPTGGRFVHAASIPEGTSVEAVRAALEAIGPVVCQGLDRDQLASLGAGEGSMLMGSSARLELSGYRPPHKVRNLARRAKSVQLEELSPDAAGTDQEALELAAYGGRATLRYVFRAQVADAQRAFVARSEGRSVGMLSLTQTGPGAWHLELLVRHPEAPDGAMEALISRVVEILQSEHQIRLDLGQVAFHVEESELQGLGALNRLLLAGVPAAVAATGGRFNFEGLRRFKAKFEAQWVPRYFAGWPRLRKRDLRAAIDAADLGQFVRLF